MVKTKGRGRKRPGGSGKDGVVVDGVRLVFDSCVPVSSTCSDMQSASLSGIVFLLLCDSCFLFS